VVVVPDKEPFKALLERRSIRIGDGDVCGAGVSAFTAVKELGSSRIVAALDFKKHHLFHLSNEYARQPPIAVHSLAHVSRSTFSILRMSEPGRSKLS
jgi:hypothetical protein